MENVKHREKQSNVFEKLFSSIMSGQYAQGERIPNELELAEQYGVSRPTVAKALGILEKKGLIYRKSGVGTFVRKPEIVAQ